MNLHECFGKVKEATYTGLWPWMQICEICEIHGKIELSKTSSLFMALMEMGAFLE